MMIQQIPLSKIKFDKGQPRKFIDQDKVKDMAQSIKMHGVINPIEVDKDFKIVTGELRFRSSKEAGLKSIPTKVIEVKPKERFVRQFVENAHHNTMSGWDTAKALERMLGVRQANDEVSYSKLGGEIGKSKAWICEHLSLLSSGKEFSKALQKDEIKKSYAVTIQRAKPEHRKILEEKVLKGEIKHKNAIHKMNMAIKENPDRADKLLAMKFTTEDEDQAIERVREVAETISDVDRDARIYFKNLEEAARRLDSLLVDAAFKDSPIKGGYTESVERFVKHDLKQLATDINKFVGVFEKIPKQIRTEIIEGEIE